MYQNIFHITTNNKNEPLFKIKVISLENYEQFKRSVALAAQRFKEIFKGPCNGKCVRIVSHLDADGITAASILINALNRENINYSISIVQQLNSKIIDSLKKEDYECFMFTDLASEYASELSEKLKDKYVFILDHHEFSKNNIDSLKNKEKFVFTNPILFGIDGGKDISGAGVVYLFAKELNKENKDSAYLAVLGAVGDVQEDKGFRFLNDEILKEAVNQEMIEINEGLRAFGSQTRPLYKILEYSNNPYIPDVSGNESKAIQFLQEIRVNPKKGTQWKKMSDLTREENKRLIAGIIMRRAGEENPEDVLGYNYLLVNEKRGTPFRDAKEFSTLLNACGRMKKASFGIGACLGDKRSKQRAMRALEDYKRNIVSAMRWYREGHATGFITKGDGYMIINAGENIPSTIIGTVASMITKGNELEEGTLFMGLAHTIEGTTKISLRIANPKNNIKDIDLREIMKEISSHVEGEYGGHHQAAGAIIRTEREEEFIEAAKRILALRAIEERVS
ncbi:DHHA1 domain-containing protein [candidate division KSB1 bacterium]